MDGRFNDLRLLMLNKKKANIRIAEKKPVIEKIMYAFRAAIISGGMNSWPSMYCGTATAVAHPVN